MITIRGIQLEHAPYTDRDLARLSAFVGDLTLDVGIAEKSAAQLMRVIFPDMPDEWTAGDRLALHNAEILPIVEYLKTKLLNDEQFINALKPLKNSAIGEQISDEVDALLAEAGGKRLPRPAKQPRNRRDR